VSAHDNRCAAKAPPALADEHSELADLDSVLAAALAKNPDDRFARCSGFARAFAEQAGSDAPVTSRRLGHARPPRDRTNDAVVLDGLVELKLPHGPFGERAKVTVDGDWVGLTQVHPNLYALDCLTGAAPPHRDEESRPRVWSYDTVDGDALLPMESARRVLRGHAEHAVDLETGPPRPQQMLQDLDERTLVAAAQ
jgi:hypothetical protein